MNYKFAILLMLLSLFINGCSNKQVENRSIKTSDTVLSSVKNKVEAKIIKEDDNFKVIKESETNYKVYLYDTNKNPYKELDFPKEPYVERVEENLVKVVISTGSPSNYTSFYDIKDKKESSAAIFNLLVYEHEKVVYVESGKLIISDVFDKNLYYKEIKRDFSVDFSNPGTFKVKFIENNRLQFKYLEGKDFVEKIEIIDL